MPRWRSLPAELDPDIREFTGRLRGLVDRGGLSVAALADRTGCGETSWERFLNARALPPRAAVHALAEATQADPRRLDAAWERAERAFSRAEMCGDSAPEAGRAARVPAEPGGGPEAEQPAEDRPRHRAEPPDSPNGPVLSADSGPGEGPPRPEQPPQRPPEPPPEQGPEQSPEQPPEQPPERSLEQPVRRSAPHAPNGRRRVRSSRPEQAAAAAPDPEPYAVLAPPALGAPKEAASRKRRIALALTGVAAVLAAAAVALVAYDLTSADRSAAGPSAHAPHPTAHRHGGGPSGTKRHGRSEEARSAERRPDVKCHGSACTGQDPERMRCGARNAESAASARVGGSRIEVRYSEACHAAWGRLTDAAHGDGLKVSAGGSTVRAQVGAGHEAFTAMVAAPSAARARACATLASGAEGCTHATRRP